MSKYIISPSPHLHSGTTTRQIMLDVVLALLPALGASLWLFGMRAALVVGVCVVTCVATEIGSNLLMGRRSVQGGVFAIGVVKMLFGGIGCNFVNPALMGRVILTVSFPEAMSRWGVPLPLANTVDAVSAATPLQQLATDGTTGVNLTDMLMGLRAGSLGETCVLALIIGGLYLVMRRVISPLIPLTFAGTVFVFGWAISGSAEVGLWHVLSGGVVLGAVFMATDYTTTPLTKSGKFLFAVGCGVITMTIRLWGALPEGVSFGILLMNVASPLIERLTRARIFGAAEAALKARKGAAKL